MAENRTCEECGAELPANAPEGLCPRCLVAMGLQLATPEKDTVGAVPPIAETSERIGRYQVLQKIGEGGYGTVYLAEQTEPVRRRVALKVVKLGMDTKQVVARFEAERQALALMDHPNIAKVLDGGATEAGRPYFVMEWVKGVKITDYCDQNNLSTGERLGLFTRVCQAIQHAHQKGIIHRDIKPSNILVTLHDGLPVPKVIDFGIAKATEQPLTEKTLFTAFNQFIGTPAYMSPEQVELSGLDTDTRGDIYSLGVLLYELLTGTTPFETKELLAAGLDALRRTIREKEPLRPSARLRTMEEDELTTTAKCRQCEAPKLIALLRGDLDWIVMKTLEKDRTRRYETANGLAMDIQRHLNHEPVVAAAPSAFYAFSKFARRHRAALAAVAGVALALLVGFLFSTWMFLRERAARQAAVEEKKRADEQTAITQAVSDFLSRNLLGPSSEMNPFESSFKTNPGHSALDELESAAASIGEKFKDKSILEAKLRQAIGDAYSAAEVSQPTLALPHYERSVALRKRVLGPDHADTLHSMKSLATALAASGRLAEAISLNEEALKLIQAKFGPEHEENFLFMFSLANDYDRQGETAQAISVYEKMRRMTKTRADGDGGWVLIVLRQLASAYEKRKELDKLEAICREFLAIRQQKDGTNSMLAAVALAELGKCLIQEQKFIEAEQVLRKSVGIEEDEHPDRWGTFNTRSLLGAAILGQRRFSAAEPLLLSSYSGMKQREDEMPVDRKDRLGNALGRLVQLYTEWDKPAQAEDWKKILEAFEKAASQQKAGAK